MAGVNHARNCVVFRENLHSWHKFYMTAGRDGRDKSQLCGKSEKFLFHGAMNRSYADVSEFMIMIIFTIMVIYTGEMLM